MKKKIIIAISIIAILLISGCIVMPKLYEYQTGDGFWQDFRGDLGRKKGQTFTVGTIGDNDDFLLTSVEIKLQRTGDGGGTAYLEIYKVDSSGLPTGSALTQETFEGGDIVVSPAEEEKSIRINTNVVCNKNTQYAIVVYQSPGDNATNQLYIGENWSSSYSGGDGIDYTPATGWMTSGGFYDRWFKVWGVKVPVTGVQTSKPYERPPEDEQYFRDFYRLIRRAVYRVE